MNMFRSRGPLRRERPAVLLLGNYLRGERLAMVTEVCEEMGLRHERVGRGAAMSASPAVAIGNADIVIGYGRSLLEGMACGRAAYVFDHLGGDGWVTAESYPALESDGFAGLGGRVELTRSRLRSDLLAYDPHMGVVNESLVRRAHSAWDHARELAEVFASVAKRPRARLDSGRELARITRLQWHADWRSDQLLREVQGLRAALLATEDQAERTAALAETRRWRAVQRLLAPIDALRARLRRVRAALPG
jgi:hypothetical protein